ncbi:MAG: ribonuclease P protein component [Gemmatimonadales bacterium]
MPARLPRERRLTRASDVRRCLASGRRWRGGVLDFIWMGNSVGHPRLGLVVPRFQQTAVARNRLRRRLKDLWRREVQGSQPAWDLVIRARRDSYAASFAALRAELLEWRQAAG